MGWCDNPLMEPEIGDALGLALLGHLDEGDGWHVLERDDGMVEAMDAAIYFSEPGDWPAGEASALEHARGRALDIGAGAGRYTLAMERRGHEVVALDVSPGAVEVCRRRGVREVIRGGVWDLDDPDGFDTFVLCGRNLGLLENRRHANGFLGRLRHLARPGARIVGTTMDPLATTDPIHLAYHERNRARGREPGQATLRVRYRRTATDWFDYWYLTPDELASVATVAGWSVTVIEPLESGSYLAVLELAG